MIRSPLVCGRRRRAGRAEPRARGARVARDARALRPLPPRRGPPDHRGLPGRREDRAREVGRALARPLVLAAAVHARPAADGRDRRQRLQPAHERVRVQARPRVRERAARGRDQPRVAEDAVRAARGDAGDAGHDRRSDVSARAAVLRGRDPEPDRVRGHVSAARGAARPLHGAAVARLSALRRGGADARRADDGAAARPPRSGGRPRRPASARSRPRERCSSRRRSASTSSR